MGNMYFEYKLALFQLSDAGFGHLSQPGPAGRRTGGGSAGEGHPGRRRLVLDKGEFCRIFESWLRPDILLY